jgi:hypothetical protein
MINFIMNSLWYEFNNVSKPCPGKYQQTNRVSFIDKIKQFSRFVVLIIMIDLSLYMKQTFDLSKYGEISDYSAAVNTKTDLNIYYSLIL